jgi:hypothetical protein
MSNRVQTLSKPLHGIGGYWLSSLNWRYNVRNKNVSAKTDRTPCNSTTRTVGAYKISSNPKESSNISQYTDNIDQPNQIMLITAIYLDRYI